MKVILVVSASIVLIVLSSYVYISHSEIKTNRAVVSLNIPNPLLSDTLDVNGLRLLAVSVQDKKAVLSLGGGETIVVSKGDFIGGGKLMLSLITNQKIILKSKASEEMYFIYLQDESENAKKRPLVQKISAMVKYQPTKKTSVTLDPLLEKIEKNQ